MILLIFEYFPLPLK